MFALCIFLICILEFTNSHLLDVPTPFANATLMQAEFALAMAAVAFSKNTMRERAVLDVIFIWAVWILATDLVPYFPPMLASIETGVFVALVACVYFRSYHHMQGPLNPANVYIAFYGGPNAPFLSRITSHFGFPFSSVAICGNLVAIRPSKSRGEMVKTSIEILRSKGYFFIDTGQEATPELICEMLQLEGTKTGHRFLRIKCLKNLMPVLESLGDEWEPKGWPMFPARYYRKCLENVT